MAGTGDNKADCYSALDRRMMDAWATLRERTLTPVLAKLSNAGVTADGVTLWSFVLGLAFCPLFFVNKEAALLCLVLHVAVDGLDGPLARYRGTASAKGSLTDTFCDQTIVATSMATLIFSGHVDAIAGSLYIFTYTLVVAFAMIRNAMTVPYSLVLRPRFFVYGWLFVELYVMSGYLNTLVWALLLPLSWQTWRGFRAIRGKLGEDEALAKGDQPDSAGSPASSTTATSSSSTGSSR
jgi:phosphatidylglycerophosphate synthase